MGAREAMPYALAVLMCVLAVAGCMARTAELRGLLEVHPPAPVLRTLDAPMVTYPDTRECALHGASVVVCFGDERFEVVPTRDELRYGMRYSREP